MEKKLKQIIRENRWKFLNHESHENYDRFNTMCLLVPSDEEGTSFSLRIMSGGGNSENEKAEPLILYDELIDFTTEEFKTFMSNCSKKYEGQVEFCIPEIWLLFFGISDNPTVENMIELIDTAVADKDWSLGKEGIGFNIVDRTM